MTALTPGEMQEALALSQAACYASMSAKEHREGSEQGKQMLRLTTRLVDMTLAALDGTAPDIQPKPGEPTLDAYVEQAKAVQAAGVLAAMGDMLTKLGGTDTPAPVAEQVTPPTDVTPSAETVGPEMAAPVEGVNYQPLPI